MRNAPLTHGWFFDADSPLTRDVPTRWWKRFPKLCGIDRERQLTLTATVSPSNVQRSQSSGLLTGSTPGRLSTWV